MPINSIAFRFDIAKPSYQNLIQFQIELLKMLAFPAKIVRRGYYRRGYLPALRGFDCVMGDCLGHLLT